MSVPGTSPTCGQRVELLHLGEPEVEQADVDLVRLGEEDVRRLDVAVDDPLAVGVRERLEHLRRRLDRRGVVELARRHRLAQGAARDVLVGDVDVVRVARERVDPLTARVPKRRCGSGLAVGALGDAALSADHLERDVEPVSLVAGEPYMTHPARSEGPQRAIAAEDQLFCRSGGAHVRFYFMPGRSPSSFPVVM